MCHFDFTNDVNNEYFWYNKPVWEIGKMYDVYVSQMTKIWFYNTCSNQNIENK